jgi:hypothetical protein
MADPAAPEVSAIDPADPQGPPVLVPAENWSDALNQGFRRAPDPNDTLLNQLGAGAEGVAQGLIPGAPSIEADLLPKSGSIEEQKKRAETFPLTSGASKLLGGGLQMAGIAYATGGLGELVAPAVDAAEDVGKGVGAVEAVTEAGASPGAIGAAADAAASQAPKTAEEAANAVTLANASPPAGGVPMGYLQQAAAGAGNNASNYINESELGDHQYNGESLVQDLGIGAITGALSEGAINILRDTIAPPVIARAGKMLDTLQGKAREAFVKAVETANPEVRGLVNPAIDAGLAGAEKTSNASAEEFAKVINSAKDGVDDLTNAHFGEYQPKEFEKGLADIPTSQVLGAEAGTPGTKGLLAVQAGIDQDLGVIQQRLEKSGSGYAGGKAFDNIAEANDRFKVEISKPGATANDLQKATLQFRRDVDASGIWGRSTDAALSDDLKKAVRNPLMDALSNPDMWGKEMADRNAAINKTFTTMLNAKANALGDLGRGELNDVGKKEFNIDPAKLRNALNGDPLANKARLQHLDDYIQAAKDYVAEAGKSASNAGAPIPGGDDLHALLESAVAKRRAASAVQPLVDLQKNLATSQRWGFGALGVAPTVGMAAHLAGAGPAGVIAAGGLGAMVRAPVKAIQMYAKISGTAAAARDAIGSGVRKMFATAERRAVLTGLVSNAIRGRSVQSANGAASGSDFAKQAKHIGELAADPGRLQQNLQDNTGRLASVAPNTAMAALTTSVRGINLLNAAIPRNPAPSSLASENKDWKPNGSDLDQWNDLHGAILNPPSFLTKLADGTASPQVWQALQQVYPAWTAELQKSVTDHLASHPKLELDNTQKLAASMVMGSPISPTVAPDQIAFQQAIYAPPPPQAPAGGAPKKPTQGGLAKLDLGSRSMAGHQRSK